MSQQMIYSLLPQLYDSDRTFLSLHLGVSSAREPGPRKPSLILRTSWETQGNQSIKKVLWRVNEGGETISGVVRKIDNNVRLIGEGC